MNQTATQQQATATSGPSAVPQQRSLRGTVAAISTLTAIAGHAVSALRFTALSVAGDSVNILARDAEDARAIAVALHLPASSCTRTVVMPGHPEHTWRGDVAGLHLTVTGRGILLDETPDRLVAAVTEPWAGPAPDLGPCPDDVHAALTGDEQEAPFPSEPLTAEERAAVETHLERTLTPLPSERSAYYAALTTGDDTTGGAA